MTNDDQWIEGFLLDFLDAYLTTSKNAGVVVSDATATIKAKMLEARIETAETIHSLFDMALFSPTGTMLDPHMMARSKEEVAESRRYNSDHSWACLSAQETIKTYIAELKALAPTKKEEE